MLTLQTVTACPKCGKPRSIVRAGRDKNESSVYGQVCLPCARKAKAAQDASRTVTVNAIVTK